MGLLVLLAGLAGCETIGYYSQAIGGQLSVTFARQPVARVLADPDTSAALRQRLRATTVMLDYLDTELDFQSGRRYRSYVQLNRDAVVYNLVATKTYSVEPRRWCYPVAGCAPYRGYFSHRAAAKAAVRYGGKGYTTTIGRVPAYSTLGWFADPLLSSFVFWNDAQLMTLLAHELSHSRIWVASDVAFNEGFATFVGEQAARDWLHRAQPELLAQHQAERREWRALVALLLQLKAALANGYAAAATDAEKAMLTESAYEAFRACYSRHRARLGAGRFDEYAATVNNATLAALATYRVHIPAFALLYQRSGARWAPFFEAVDALVALPAEQRATQLAALRQLSQQQIAHAGDDGDADQVQCQALAHHGIDRHVP